METKVKETVRGAFERYLQSRGLRRTQERFAILDAIYSIEGHFTMEELMDITNASKFHVSRATLYNTMDLLSDAHLVIRHKFDNSAQYDEKLRQAIENAHSKGFTIVHSAFYMYGICSKCVASKRRLSSKGQKQKEQKTNK